MYAISENEMVETSRGKKVLNKILTIMTITQSVNVPKLKIHRVNYEIA